MFDVATDMGQVSTQVACSKFLRDTGPLGGNCSLFWYSARELWIRLGSQATILPGEDLSFLTSVIRNAKRTSSFTAGSVRVRLPDTKPSTTAIIEGPSQIGTCDVLTLDARSSTGSAGRDLRFRWGVLPGGVSD